MQNIYTESIERVSNGARFLVDYQQRSLKINGRYIIKKGEHKGDLGLKASSDPLPHITSLYKRYQHSLPSERSESKHKRYFAALPEHELTDEDMFFGEQRDIAQIKLELYVLIMILNGSLKWNDFAEGKWFWQSPEVKELIILKDWIEPTTSK